MRIAIATSGRFHVLDLARELAALGHEVAFHTVVPAGRAGRFGLPRGCHRPLLVSLLPWVVALRLGPRGLRRWLEKGFRERLDRLIAGRLEPCDVFIGMSGLCVESARVARARYGAIVFIERGSRHILSQKEILESIPANTGKQPIPAYAVERELRSYGLADVVVVPSRHAEASFLERGFPASRLFRNPYGVDLAMFPPTPCPPPPETVISVGTWSYQKGGDVLVRALRFLPDVRLLHVGPIGDLPFPSGEQFRHAGAVPQWELPRQYARAHVLVQASRQDGLSLVLAQALACGLPVVCTDRTGGEDLAELVGLKEDVIVVPHGDPRALADGIRCGLVRARAQRGRTRDLLAGRRGELSWRAYGERYEARLLDALRERRRQEVWPGAMDDDRAGRGEGRARCGRHEVR